MVRASSVLFTVVCGSTTLAAAWLHAADAQTEADAGVPTAKVAAVPTLPPTARPNLEAIAADALAQFAPVSDDEVRQARRQLSDALAQLDKQLKANGVNGQAWKRYLLWSELQEQLTFGNEPNLTALKAVQTRYQATHDGLHLPRFLGVRRALNKYVTRVEALNNPHAEVQFAQYLQTINQGVDAYLQTSASDSLLQVAEAVAALEALERAPSVVDGVKAQFSQPNIHFEASEELLSTGLGRQIDEVARLNNMINGAHVTGNGHTVGRLHAELIADDDRAMLLTRMIGTTYSKTVGRKGPALVYSNGETKLLGEKRFYIDASGVHDLPAKVAAEVSTDITGVGTTKRGLLDRIIKRIAWRRIPSEKPASEREAGRIAERMFATRMDREARENLARVNHQYSERIRKPLVLRDQFPPIFELSTTSEELRVLALHTAGTRFGAQSPAPQIVGRPDLAVRLHESTVNNTLASIFAGRLLTSEEVERRLIETLGELPEKMRDEDGQEPWSVTFASPNPITLKIDNNQVELTLRGDRYTSGPKVYDAMYVTVRYEIEHTGQSVIARRIGDLEILPPGFDAAAGQQLALRQTVLRRLLQKRFGKIFEPEIVTNGLQLPGEWEKVGTLWATQFVANDGWLLLGWDTLQTVERNRGEQRLATQPQPATAK